MRASEKIKLYWEERAKNSDFAATSTTDDIYLRKLEIRAITDTLLSLPLANNHAIADLGCGDGYSTIHVAMDAPNFHFYGIDYSQNMIAIAQRRLHETVDLSNRVSFALGDVTNLTSCFGNTLFRLAVTDRCLINLESYDEQIHAISQIANHVELGGYYIAIENFVEGHNNMNEVRSAMKLPEIKIRWHNLYFTEDEFKKAVQPFFELVELKNFTSSYYYATRVIYSKMCQLRNEQPDYSHDIHKLAVDLPPFGNFSPIKMALLRRV
jgi:ubiquinone/menaquinone biosynthesis C-methylase UbiE